MTIVERAKAPTSKFFRILRTIGLALLGISGSVMAAPVALPAAMVTAAGYIAVAGGVLSAFSQITVDPMTDLMPQNKAKNEEDDYHQPEGGKPDG
jgi:ABC-type xylose transport system permease subunit